MMKECYGLRVLDEASRNTMRSLFAFEKSRARNGTKRARSGARKPPMKPLAFVLAALPLASAHSLWAAPASLSAGATPKVSALSAAPLHFALNDNGISELSYKGVSLLNVEGAGQPMPIDYTPNFTRANGTTYVGTDQPLSSTLDKAKHSVTRVYPWGRIICTYSRRGSALRIRTRVENSTSDQMYISVQLLEPTFGQRPQGLTLDAGMFGEGGYPYPLGSFPLETPPDVVPPVILIDYGAATLAFCDETQSATPATISVPRASNDSKTQFPFFLTPPKVEAGQSVETLGSLRFGASGATAKTLAPDVLRDFAARYPFRLAWKDRRAVAALFLSTAEAHPPLNPRGWFTNASDVDTTTPEGRQVWRKRLMDYADYSIKIMRSMNSQGMVTWDPTGDEIESVSFYGDPTQIDTVAPETLTQADPNPDGSDRYDSLAAIDAYFAKFRDAGFRVGLCIRPQELHLSGGEPSQDDSPDPTATLARKITYARKRWGCTLFYVDSTVDAHGSLPAAIFEKLMKQFPDVLLMPENESPRYFGTTAPFNSFALQGVTSTPAVTHQFYPRAFSVIYAPFGDFAHRRAELLAAVKSGDILIFNGWYDNEGNTQIKSIYDEAGVNKKMPSHP